MQNNDQINSCQNVLISGSSTGINKNEISIMWTKIVLLVNAVHLFTTKTFDSKVNLILKSLKKSRENVRYFGLKYFMQIKNMYMYTDMCLKAMIDIS